MKKVGFIDNFFHNWHALNYPELLKKASNGKYVATYGYCLTESPADTGLTNKDFEEKTGIQILDTIEEVIEKSDVLIVCSPNNPELHLQLCELPLKSGKPTYVDKTFAPDKATAKAIFAIAEANNTPCYSSSALRFSSEIQDIDADSVKAIYSEGPYSFDTYSIHQIEPVVAIMKSRAKRVMATSYDINHPSYIVEFENGKCAYMHHCAATFRFVTADARNIASTYNIESDFFSLFMQDLVRFFDTGVISVPHSQTIDVIAIRETAKRAFDKPFTWFEI